MLFHFMLLVFPILSSNCYLLFQHSVPPRKRGKNLQGSIIKTELYGAKPYSSFSFYGYERIRI